MSFSNLHFLFYNRLASSRFPQKVAPNPSRMALRLCKIFPSFTFLAKYKLICVSSHNSNSFIYSLPAEFSFQNFAFPPKFCFSYIHHPLHMYSFCVGSGRGRPTSTTIFELHGTFQNPPLRIRLRTCQLASNLISDLPYHLPSDYLSVKQNIIKSGP